MTQHHRLALFLGTYVITLFWLRIFLFFSPFTNFNLGPYNIHHLFTGALLLIILIPFLLFEVRHWLITGLLGIGTALVSDEIIYLVVTDGSDRAYLTTSSLWGSVGLAVLVIILTSCIYYFKKTR